MKALSDMTPDELLEVLERRIDAYADAHDLELAQKRGQQALEAATYRVYRAQGISQEDAKRRMLEDDERLKGQEAYDNAANQALRAKMKLQSVQDAMRLWQTQRADQRRI